MAINLTTLTTSMPCPCLQCIADIEKRSPCIMIDHRIMNRYNLNVVLTIKQTLYNMYIFSAENAILSCFQVCCSDASSNIAIEGHPQMAGEVYWK